MDVPVSVASEGEMVTVEDSDALLANASAGSPATHRIHPNSETGEPWDSGHMSDGAAYVTLAVLLLAGAYASASSPLPPSSTTRTKVLASKASRLNLKR